MKNTIVLSSPRSGGNFLMSVLSDVSNVYNASEFFSGGDDGNLYCINHLHFVQSYYKHNYKKDYALQIYQKMFQLLSDIKNIKGHNRNALNVQHLDLLMDFIEHHPQEQWSITLKRQIEKNQLLVKVFYNHYNHENHFNLDKAVKMFENVILLYRENLLNQFISFETAIKTNDWHLGINENRKITTTKIKWNLEKYLCYREDIIKWTRDYKKILSDFKDKKTAIIKYEDIAKPKGYIQEIARTLELSGIYCELGNCSTVKQSKESIDTADKFVNKEEFLDDYSKIKNKILLNLGDI